MRVSWRKMVWPVVALLLCGVSYTVYVQTAGTPGRAAARARGCCLCHNWEEPLPSLRHWRPGESLRSVIAERLAQEHPLLQRGAEDELTTFVTDAQLPALMKLQAGAPGQALYMAKCAVCHGRDGMGKPGSYPPVRGSEWLMKEDELPIILTQGLHGPISVKGETWDKTMRAPGLKSQEEVQDVIRYLRSELAK